MTNPKIRKRRVLMNRARKAKVQAEAPAPIVEEVVVEETVEEAPKPTKRRKRRSATTEE